MSNRFKIIEREGGRYLRYKQKGFNFITPIEKNGLLKAKKYLILDLKSRRYARKNTLDARPKIFGKSRLSYATVGNTFLHYDTILSLLKAKKEKVFFKEKSPKNNAKYIGIELEFTSSEKQSTLAKKLIDANLHKNTYLKQDGSIETAGSARDCENGCHDCGMEVCEHDGCPVECTENHCHGEHECCCDNVSDDIDDIDESQRYGHEINILGSEKQIFDLIDKTCAVLNETCQVNKSCGFHVHLDMRSYSKEQIDIIAKNLLIMQPLLYSMVPEARFNNRYCQPIFDFSVARELDRYHGINLQALISHKTIEIRIHSGTLNPTKIKQWVKILLAIKNAKPLDGLPLTINDLKTNLGLQLDTIKYIFDRLKKFKGNRDKKIEFLPRFEKETMGENLDLFDNKPNYDIELTA